MEARQPIFLIHPRSFLEQCFLFRSEAAISYYGNESIYFHQEKTVQKGDASGNHESRPSLIAKGFDSFGLSKRHHFLTIDFHPVDS